ncbi:helix-turn-helix transcriptional regulator [Streptomyces sp. UH6]|uniref:helix-turn-helix domain-containing protein n=1 Tax=Streptomyces sp. UH6 TaxID=2748379 RepID=UPI0015D51FEF|nr:helix-turn-helix transcriptional regulator [Streptomyces sp. UH6]NYV73652.1 helix-turn-helix domain-containing protein [Streptomyces sp. UH6]
MTQDWARLGALLRTAREDRLALSQADLGERIGVGRNALRAVEAGTGKRITPTIRRYAHEVGWTEDSIESVLAGGEPVLREDSADTAAQAVQADAVTELAKALVARLPARVLQELADGEVMDTDIVDLRKDGSSAVMTLVVKRGDGPAQPDQVREDLSAWAKAQRELRRMLPGS